MRVDGDVVRVVRGEELLGVLAVIFRARKTPNMYAHPNSPRGQAVPTESWAERVMDRHDREDARPKSLPGRQSTVLDRVGPIPPVMVDTSP